MQQASPGMSLAHCFGLPFTRSGESSRPTASLQVSASLNQGLSSGLICSELLTQRWQTDLVLFLPDWKRLPGALIR